MSKSHNKKRNVGLIYEQLLSYISKCLVENKKEKAQVASAILRSHFSPDTELYREFRLFNALAKTFNCSDAISVRILSEAKTAAQDHSYEKLRAQKSSLIRDINHMINESGFYSQKVEDYRLYATIQTLLNEWRSNTPDIGTCISYEKSLLESLTSKRIDESLESQKTEEVDPLTVKIMTEKFNKKYNAILSEGQRDLLKRFVLNESDQSAVRQELESLKENALTSVKKYKKICENKVVEKKIDKVLSEINNFDPADTSDLGIAKALTICKLNEELEEKRNV